VKGTGLGEREREREVCGDRDKQKDVLKQVSDLLLRVVKTRKI